MNRITYIAVILNFKLYFNIKNYSAKQYSIQFQFLCNVIIVRAVIIKSGTKSWVLSLSVLYFVWWCWKFWMNWSFLRCQSVCLCVCVVMWFGERVWWIARIEWVTDAMDRRSVMMSTRAQEPEWVQRPHGRKQGFASDLNYVRWRRCAFNGRRSFVSYTRESERER